MPQLPWLSIVVAAVVVWNLATWAIYRVDKRRAGRGQRRIPERVLLAMAAVAGSPGALVAVYGHRQRHKARKPGFVVPLWLIVVAQLAAVAVAAGALRP